MKKDICNDAAKGNERSHLKSLEIHNFRWVVMVGLQVYKVILKSKSTKLIKKAIRPLPLCLHHHNSHCSMGRGHCAPRLTSAQQLW